MASRPSGRPRRTRTDAEPPDAASAAQRGLAALPSLGPVSAQMLVEAGVPDPQTLRALGAVECWRRLKFAFGRRVTLNFLYALDCAVQDRDWRVMTQERRAELRREAMG